MAAELATSIPGAVAFVDADQVPKGLKVLKINGLLPGEKGLSAALRNAHVIGKTVSHYRILSTLGKGGMGVVYKAEDTRLGRTVALKFVPESLAHDRIALERFQREARAVSALNHPNICTLHDIGEIRRPSVPGDGVPGGPDPRGPHRRGRCPWTKCWTWPSRSWTRWMRRTRAASCIATSSRRTSFVTTRGQVKMLDFGLAKMSRRAGIRPSDRRFADGDRGSGNPGHQSRAPPWAPWPTCRPSRRAAKRLDARTDLFSFGVVLYEMVTGHRAVPRQYDSAHLRCHSGTRSIAALQHRPDLPAELERIILKALEKNRDLRYQTAADMRGDLKRLRRDSDSSRRLMSAQSMRRRWKLRLPAAP